MSLQEKDKPNSTTMNGSPGSAGMGDQMGVKIEPAEAESLSGSSGILTPVSPYTCVKPISPEQEELINRLVSFQCEFEQPSEDDLKRITVCILHNCAFNCVYLYYKFCIIHFLTCACYRLFMKRLNLQNVCNGIHMCAHTHNFKQKYIVLYILIYV